VVGLERKYEVLYISRPNLAEGGHEEVTNEYKKLISGSLGSIVDVEDWGSRIFTFEIEKHEKGNYVLLTFMMDPKNLPELESRFKLDDRVLRYQIVGLEESKMPSAVAA